MKARRFWLSTLGALLGAVAPLAAQQHTNQSRGFDPRGVFQVGDVDAINLFNGALTVTIPLGPRFPVGPTDYGFALVYNSNAWSVREVCTEGVGDRPVGASGWPDYTCNNSTDHCELLNYTPPIVWGAPQDDFDPRPAPDCTNLSLPNPMSNAGLGWQLNFGKLLPPREGEGDRSPNLNESRFWVYVGPDGSEHSFEFDARPEWRTKDAAFLRLLPASGCPAETTGCKKVESADGGTEVFGDFAGPNGPDWRLLSRRDRFGNGFSVSYSNPLAWVVHDSEGRDHLIELVVDPIGYQPVLKRLLLEASHGKILEIVLEHQQRSIARGAPHNDPLAGPTLAVPLLEYVRLREYGSATELSRWSMTPVEAAYFFQDDSGPPLVRRPVQIPGVLRRLEVPTGARLSWRFGAGYRFPNGSGGRRNLRTTTGVLERSLTDVDGSPLGVWTYEPRLFLLDEATYSACGDLAGQTGEGFPFEARCHEKHFQNSVTDPVGVRTVHHFSVYSLPSVTNPGSLLYTPEGWDRGDYGLPFSRHESVDGMFLSTEVYPSTTSPAVRRTYVRYEADPGPLTIDGWGADTRNNHRPAASRTVYLDDPVLPSTIPPQYHYRESVSSNYAGFGRYRRTEQRSGGSWPSGSGQAEGQRFEFTDWQPDEAHWVADLFTRRSVREGSRQEQVEYRFELIAGDRGLAPTATRRLYNDTVSGPLSEDRTMAPSSKDILTHLEYDSHGNVTRETSWGADRQSLPPVTEVAGSLFQPSADRAGALVRHFYTAGVRSKTEILDPCRGANAVVVKVLDLTIDSRSGLPTASRDDADVGTGYAYDALGRLLAETPTGTATTTYQHLLRGSSTPPPVGNGAQVIATTGNCCDHYRRARWHYDGLGRLVQESREFPAIDGALGGLATANRFYEYNGVGWSTAESTWRYGGADFTGIERALEVANGSTKYSQFDAFGRPGRTTPPEGSQHDVVVSRTGDRLVTTTAKVATGETGQETAVSRTEEYDVFGRLVAVKEPSGANGAVVTSSYRYDAGNRLIEVKTISGTVTQTRNFDYDGLGFLREETHPELGVAGNGTLKLGFYDVRGSVGTREIGGLTGTNRRGLDYRYDAAGRLVEIFDVRDVIDRQPIQPPLQQYFYATANANGGRQKGKLVRTRQRHPETGLWVAEDFVYQEQSGRMTSRAVKVTGGPNGSPRFSQAMTYTTLGELASLSYPQCQATEASCRQATEALGRTIDLVYQRGLPWGVTMAVKTAPEAEPTISGLAGPILYSAHGGVRQIPHANGVTDTVTNDPKGQARPQRIAFQKGGSAQWDSGTFQYDGAGNLWGLGVAGEPVPQQRFQYDGVGRLVDGQVRRQGQATLSREQIAYDAFGNWTGRAVNGVGIPVPQVNPATNRFTGEGVNYDASGNLLQWSLTSPQLKFDLLDRVIERKDGPTTWQYLYTASGERVIEKNAATGLERWTLRGPDNQVLRTVERQPSGQWSLLRDNLFAGRRLLAAHSPAGLHHFHLDHLGSVRLETDAAGNPIKYRDFLPFGESLETGGGTENRLLYTGHQRDDMATPTTVDDLDYMHARYCSPTFGRFLSVDPVLGRAPVPQSWNRYAYVQGNPVKLVDPDGRNPVPSPMEVLNFQMWLGQKLVNGWVEHTRAMSDLLSTPDGQRTFMLMHMFAAVTPMAPDEAGMVSTGPSRATGSRVSILGAAGVPAAGARGGLAPNMVGNAGEAAVRAVADIGPKVRISVNGRIRLPDGLNRATGVLSEVKNTASLGLTPQLKDYSTFAQANGLRFDLWVRPETSLSGPLEQAIASGTINLRFIP